MRLSEGNMSLTYPGRVPEASSGISFSDMFSGKAYAPGDMSPPLPLPGGTCTQRGLPACCRVLPNNKPRSPSILSRREEKTSRREVSSRSGCRHFDQKWSKLTILAAAEGRGLRSEGPGPGGPEDRDTLFRLIVISLALEG